MNPDIVLPHNRHKTAISRIDYSRPIKTALADGLIASGATVLDFGCGLGDDIRYLDLKGIEAWGWDPAHCPDGNLAPAEIVNLGYVINVIENFEERVECLQRAWSFARRALIVSARLASETPEFAPVAPYADGYVTSIATFQKLYEQAGLKDWIEQHLDAPTVAAAPGVFYVFRDDADRIGFLASRYHRRYVRVSEPIQDAIEAHKDLLRPLVEFFERRGRPPAKDELTDLASNRIRERFGSLRRAFTLLRRAGDPNEFAKITVARGEDLLIFLALSRFDGRPRFGRLPPPVRLDIRNIFSTYRNACEQADAALLAVGDMQRVRAASTRSAVGKRTPSALYVHESALEDVPPLLRLYEGCARGYIGRVEGANVVKLYTSEPKVSYLSYPEFESDPHPALAESLTVHLQTFRLRERDYRGSRNPPVLHRKETFLAPNHPLHAKFSRLTRQEESKGLLEDTSTVGTRRGWNQVLSARGLTLRGHRLIRARTTNQPKA